jgi:ribose transport system substrate-binding protein
MGKLRVLVSLTTDDNDYQQLQAADAEQTAQALGVELKNAFAKNDAVEQSTQLLRAMQSSPELRPNAIILKPVGTSMLQVARSAVSAGIGWAALNREVEYIQNLRTNSVPAFVVTSDHEEIGRIQGRQIAALLPRSGVVLHIEGPSGDISRKRTKGMLNQTR